LIDWNKKFNDHVQLFFLIAITIFERTNQIYSYKTCEKLSVSNGKQTWKPHLDVKKAVQYNQ